MMCRYVSKRKEMIMKSIINYMAVMAFILALLQGCNMKNMKENMDYIADCVIEQGGAIYDLEKEVYREQEQ